MKYKVKNKTTGRERVVEADNLEELREDFPAENYEVIENESGESKGDVEKEAQAAADSAESKGKDGEAAAETVIESSSLSDEDKEDIANRVAAKINDGKSNQDTGEEQKNETGSGTGKEGTSESSQTEGKESEGGNENGNPPPQEGANPEESDKDKVTPKTEHFWYRSRGRKGG